MIIGRGLQGMGMGMVPLGIALLRDVVPQEKLSSSIALVSASMGIGGGLGLPIAAAVAQYANWRVLFWGSAALAVVIAALIWFLVPDVPGRAPRASASTLPGALGLGVGLVCLLLAVSKGADWGWGSATTLGLFAAAVVVLLGWGWWETAHPRPADRPAHHRPPPGAAHQRRLGLRRLRDVRQHAGRPAAAAVPRGHRLRPGPVDARGRACGWRPAAS